MQDYEAGLFPEVLSLPFKTKYDALFKIAQVKGTGLVKSDYIRLRLQGNGKKKIRYPAVYTRKENEVIVIDLVRRIKDYRQKTAEDKRVQQKTADESRRILTEKKQKAVKEEFAAKMHQRFGSFFGKGVIDADSFTYCLDYYLRIPVTMNALLAYAAVKLGILESFRFTDVEAPSQQLNYGKKADTYDVAIIYQVSFAGHTATLEKVLTEAKLNLVLNLALAGDKDKVCAYIAKESAEATTRLTESYALCKEHLPA